MMQLLLRALVIGVLVQGGFPVLKGPYLGQKRPGPAPEIFAPGIVSLGFHEHNIAISPDGREIFFVTASADFSRYLIMTTREENDAWTMPEVAPFSGGRNDGAPSFSSDGKRLYFSSRRPHPAGGPPADDFDIWVVERKGDSWTAAMNLGGPVNTGQQEVNPSVAADGTIYFQRIAKLGTLDWDLYRSAPKNGVYGVPEKLPAPVNTEANEAGPFIAPDGSFLLFQSNRPGSYGIMDIFVTYRTASNAWSNPVNLGEKVNSPYSDWGPTVSPDGKYLFFSSFRNVEPIAPGSPDYLEYLRSRLGTPSLGKGTLYWTDAKIIDDLKPKKRQSDGIVRVGPTDASVRSSAAEFPPATSNIDHMTDLAGIHDVSCQEALKIIQEHQRDSNFIILDFRTNEMFDESRIAGAICHDVFLPDIDDWLKALDRKKTYLIYCTLGHRSGIALEKMKETGFVNILHMHEGISRWKLLGYETVSGNTSSAIQVPAASRIPSDPLKILEPLVNRHWVGEMKSPDGSRTFKTDRNFQAIRDGSAVRYTASIPEIDSFSEGYFYWDREAQKVAVLVLSSRGVVERGTVSIENGVLTIQGTMAFPERTFDFKNTFEFTADGKMIDRWFQNASGPWQPGHVVEFKEQGK
jgi:rhodanese-related sulfurtransferase